MELLRNGLKLIVVQGLDDSEGSVNVPVKLVHKSNDQYVNFTEQVHIRYINGGKAFEEILPSKDSEFYIPGKVFIESGPIQLAVHLINGEVERVTNELQFVVKTAPNGKTLVDPSEFTWQQLVDQYVNAKLDTFANKSDLSKFEENVNGSIENQSKNIESFKTEVDTSLDNQNKKITDLQTSTQRKLDSQDTKINDFKAEVNTSLSNQTTSINQTTSVQNSKITTLEGRMDTFTSLSEGSTTGDAELKDIRVGANGITYNNAGDAVRGQYSQLKEDLAQIDRRIFMRYPYGSLLNGFWRVSDGGWNDGYNTWFSTEKIEIKKGLKFHIKSVGSSTVTAIVSLFDDNNNHIGVVNRCEDNDKEYDFILDTDSIDTRTKYISVCTKNPNSFVFEELVYPKDTYFKSKYIKGIDYISRNGYMSKNGVIQSGDLPYWYCTEPIACYYSEKLFITATATNSETPCVVFFDKNMDVILFDMVGSSSYKNFISHEIDVPNGAEWYVVSTIRKEYQSYNALDIQILQTVPIDFDTNSENIKTSKWNGKKIVWFGTSIPAGGYPQLVGKLLGATVFNESVGSSCMRSGFIEDVSDNDPYGWVGKDWLSVLLSFTLPSSKKQEVIDNWDYWQPLLINNPPVELNQSHITNALRASYDYKLDKYLSGGEIGQCDLYVFDHFHNDGLQTSEYLTIPEARSANECLYAEGAFNWLVRRILEDNPSAKIVISGHYENDRKQKVSEAQKIASDNWGIPLIPLWDLMGLSQNQIYTTGKWVDFEWIPNSEPKHLMTMTQIHIADDLHPGNNKDGKENERFAEVLARELSNIS